MIEPQTAERLRGDDRTFILLQNSGNPHPTRGLQLAARYAMTVTCLWGLSDDILELVAAAVVVEREKRRERWLAAWVDDEVNRIDDSAG